MHLLEVSGRMILLDCGLYQGSRKEAFERNRNFPFRPASIDTVVLSHAHIDHSGNLPTLVRHGFRGRIVATPATRDLCNIMLRDSAHLQEKDVEYVNKKRSQQGKKAFEPLYTLDDVNPTMELFTPLQYDRRIELMPGLGLTLHEAGHLLGSSVVSLDWSEGGRARRLLFTGDIGRSDMPILRDPATVSGVNVLVTESTYGDRVHPPSADVVGRLKGFIEDIVMQRARLVIPAFSVGRTQQIVFHLNEIYHQGRIGGVPVYVDSPLSTHATEVYEKHRECFDEEAIKAMLEGDAPFQFHGLHYVTDVADSKKLNNMQGPVIIISASGMCEAGRILHHLKNAVGDPRNIVLIVGYQAQNTLGRKLVEHVSPIRIFGEEYEVRARVHSINALSAHADSNEMHEYFRKMMPGIEKAFVVHGEEGPSNAVADDLRGLGVPEVVVPEPGRKFTV